MADTSVGRTQSLVPVRQHVIRLRPDLWGGSQDFEHLFCAASLAPSANIRFRLRHCHALRKHAGNKGLQSLSLRARDGLGALAKGVGDDDADLAHSRGSILKNCAGATTETPKPSAGRK